MTTINSSSPSEIPNGFPSPLSHQDENKFPWIQTSTSTNPAVSKKSTISSEANSSADVNNSLPSRPKLQSQQQSPYPAAVRSSGNLIERGSTSRRSLRTGGDSSTSLHSESRNDAGFDSSAWQFGGEKSSKKNKLQNEEQAVFEHRLCEDVYGVAVRKINQSGKANMRYIRCCWVDSFQMEEHQANQQLQSGGSRSMSSRSLGFLRKHYGEQRRNRRKGSMRLSKNNNKVRILTWGKKMDKKMAVKVPLDTFICIRKGKTTDRARRNNNPGSRILSLISEDPASPSLDIEAPTRLDRDKFARAFARFLDVPIEGGDGDHSMRSHMTSQSARDLRQQTSKGSQSSGSAVAQYLAAVRSNSQKSITNSVTQSIQSQATGGSRRRIPLPVVNTDRAAVSSSHSRPPKHQKSKSKTSRTAIPISNVEAITLQSRKKQESTPIQVDMSIPDPQISSLPSTTSTHKDEDDPEPLLPSTAPSSGAPTGDKVTERSAPPKTGNKAPIENADDLSVVSSITGAGFDQDIVEEMHLALTELRAELDESRAEASRAVKVAEQAIQSAESNSSKDWNSTVTHKAAEAAALAQRKSAEAMSKARQAEEKLEVERKSTRKLKKLAEGAAEDARHWQTRAAASEIQRALMSEALESEKKRTSLHSNSGNADEALLVELDRLRTKLAVQSATRRKLLNEVQDLRGTVRVYCRPKPNDSATSIISTPSQEVLLLHREQRRRKSKSAKPTPISFEFDGIFSDTNQEEIYAELEELCLSVVDGYNVCILAYGQRDSGKTLSLLGDVHFDDQGRVSITNRGLQFRAVAQYFSVLELRNDQYDDVISFSIVEVLNDRLCDLLAPTKIGIALGKVEKSRNTKRRDSVDESTSQISKPLKLEIKTNRDGETIVHGLTSVEVQGYDDVVTSWMQALETREEKSSDHIEGQKVSSHVIGTIRVKSTNKLTGVSTCGRIQFVDLACADIESLGKGSSTSKPKQESPTSAVGSQEEWKFVDKSMVTMAEVVTARSQYQREVPYRNSTITHLLSDSLEADTKVALVACLSVDPKDAQTTACCLKFAKRMRQVVIGKATKHTVSS